MRATASSVRIRVASTPVPATGARRRTVLLGDGQCSSRSVSTAVLLDADNVDVSQVRQLFTLQQNLRQWTAPASFLRAYGYPFLFNSSDGAGPTPWSAFCRDFGVEPRPAGRDMPKKDDIADKDLVWDALKLCDHFGTSPLTRRGEYNFGATTTSGARERVQKLVIISSDSDFLPLANLLSVKRLHEPVSVVMYGHHYKAGQRLRHSGLFYDIGSTIKTLSVEQLRASTAQPPRQSVSSMPSMDEARSDILAGGVPETVSVSSSTHNDQKISDNARQKSGSRSSDTHCRRSLIVSSAGSLVVRTVVPSTTRRSDFQKENHFGSENHFVPQPS